MEKNISLVCKFATGAAIKAELDLLLAPRYVLTGTHLLLVRVQHNGSRDPQQIEISLNYKSIHARLQASGKKSNRDDFDGCCWSRRAAAAGLGRLALIPA